MTISILKEKNNIIFFKSKVNLYSVDIINQFNFNGYELNKDWQNLKEKVIKKLSREFFRKFPSAFKKSKLKDIK